MTDLNSQTVSSPKSVEEGKKSTNKGLKNWKIVNKEFRKNATKKRKTNAKSVKIYNVSSNNDSKINKINSSSNNDIEENWQSIQSGVADSPTDPNIIQRKYIMLEAKTVPKFFMFWIKYIINGVCLSDDSYIQLLFYLKNEVIHLFFS